MVTSKKIHLKLETINFYSIDCTNCLYYAQVKERLFKCPKCKSTLHEKRVLY